MKRTLVLLLSALLVLGLLSGCAQETTNISANDPAPSAPAEQPQTSAEPVETPDPSDDEPVTEPAPDASADTTVAALPQPGPVALPITDELTTFTMWSGDFLDSAMPYNDPNEYPVWNELERRTNIHIDWTLATQASAAEQFSLMLTSQDYTDLFAGAGYLTGGLDYSIEEDIIIDLAELVPQYMPNYYALLTADEYTRKSAYTDTGKLGGLHPVQVSPEPPFFGYVTRQDLLDAIGFEGEMTTIADWETVLAAFKEAGYGKLHLGSTTGQQDLIMAAFNVRSTFLQKDGEVFYGPTSQSYYDYLQLIIDWNNAGYIDPDFASRASWFSDFPLMISGEIAILPTLYSVYDVIQSMGVAADPNFQVIPIDAPKMNADDKLMVQNFGGPSRVNMGGSAVCVSTACEDPVTVLRWFDYLCTDEGWLLANYGIEGESYELVDGIPVYTDVVLNDPNGYTALQMQKLYVVDSQITHWFDHARGLSLISEGAIGCTKTWCDDYDYVNAYDLPAAGALTMTFEEAEDLGSRESDIQTYVEEYTALVISGQKDLASSWDEYVANIEAMDLQACIDVYQAAYNRFLAR